jgi:hypothetical protein
MKLKGTPAGKPMKIITKEDGKTVAVVDHKAIEAKKPVCARGKTKSKFVKRGGK